MDEINTSIVIIIIISVNYRAIRMISFAKLLRGQWLKSSLAVSIIILIGVMTSNN